MATHEELMGLLGRYYQMYQLQAGHPEIAAAAEDQRAKPFVGGSLGRKDSVASRGRNSTKG